MGKSERIQDVCEWILTAMDFMWELIVGQCRLKLTENRESNLIAGDSFFKPMKRIKSVNYIG